LFAEGILACNDACKKVERNAIKEEDEFKQEFEEIQASRVVLMLHVVMPMTGCLYLLGKRQGFIHTT